MLIACYLSIAIDIGYVAIGIWWMYHYHVNYLSVLVVL